MPRLGHAGRVRPPSKYLIATAALLAGCSGTIAEPEPVASTTTTTASATTTTESTPTTTSTSSTSTTTTSTTTTTTLPPVQGFRLELIAEDLGRPIFLTSPPDDDRRFIALRDGQIMLLQPDGTIAEEPFLDLRPEVFDFGIEQGLLGVAFHPDYAANGRLFVYYTDTQDDTVLVEYTVSADPSIADRDSAQEILFVDQPTNRHNAGMLEFGPDGLLWLSLGEGGAAGTHAQNPDTILSAIVRLDVDRGDPYAIPPDNPFIDGNAPEVWAFGLRNPWRFSIDHVTRTIYIADVGHERWEEVNAVSIDSGGWNFGWLNMEGSACFQRDCDPTGKVLPVLEYSHDDGCSITGGYVYRGAAIPELHGTYFYGDWCSGFIRSFELDGDQAIAERDWTEELSFDGRPTSFGVDSQGELYVTTWGGELLKLVADRG